MTADLVRLDGRPNARLALIGMGGAVTELAAVRHELAMYEPDVVQGAVLERAEIDRQIELYREPYRRRAAPDRRAAAEASGGHPRGRVHRAHGDGRSSRVESLTVSDRGLRHGLLS